MILSLKLRKERKIKAFVYIRHSCIFLSCNYNRLLLLIHPIPFQCNNFKMQSSRINYSEKEEEDILTLLLQVKRYLYCLTGIQDS